MKDILLDETGDLAVVNYDLAFTDSGQITVQKLKQVLRFFKGEWFLNNDAGIPFYEDVLVKNNGLARIETLLIRAIQSVPEVVEIEEFNINQDNKTRKLNVSFQVRDIDNNQVAITL